MEVIIKMTLTESNYKKYLKSFSKKSSIKSKHAHLLPDILNTKNYPINYICSCGSSLYLRHYYAYLSHIKTKKHIANKKK